MTGPDGSTPTDGRPPVGHLLPGHEAYYEEKSRRAKNYVAAKRAFWKDLKSIRSHVTPVIAGPSLQCIDRWIAVWNEEMINDPERQHPLGELSGFYNSRDRFVEDWEERGLVPKVSAQKLLRDWTLLQRNRELYSHLELSETDVFQGVYYVRPDLFVLEGTGLRYMGPRPKTGF